VTRFAEASGYEVAAAEVEVETGKWADALDRRPRLKAALDQAFARSDRISEHARRQF
jgi:hypothetical protein